MKLISKEDLSILLPHIANKTLCLTDFEALLETFGDDYFIVDGQFTRTEENELMKKYREGENPLGL